MAIPSVKIQSIVDKEITVINGPASFGAKNLSGQLPEVTPQPKQQEKESLAQSPEEIRRKLKARKYQPTGVRASFTAKDL